MSIYEINSVAFGLILYLIYSFLASIFFRRKIDKRLRGLVFLFIYSSIINALLMLVLKNFLTLSDVVISKIYVASVIFCAFLASDISKYEE